MAGTFPERSEGVPGVGMAAVEVGEVSGLRVGIGS